MKIIDPKQEVSTGEMWMLYGETKVGKTTSILQSAPDPLLYIQCEPRSLRTALEAANRPDFKYKIAVYDNFDGLLEFLGQPEQFKPFQTVVLDSYSHLMGVELSTELEQQAFEARSEKDQKIKPLIMRTKLSQEGYGALASNMLRVTTLLSKIAQMGKLVIVTARVQQNPKWNRELVAAPLLKGRMFPDLVGGFFDMIGFVEHKIKSDGTIIHPPKVSFYSEDGDFLAGFSGKMKKLVGPLRIDKIMTEWREVEKQE